MTAIGGKSRAPHKLTQPQFVVQAAQGVNEYALFKLDDAGHTIISWVGDPNAASKFDSKYQAKFRVKELADVPDTRCFKCLD